MKNNVYTVRRRTCCYCIARGAFEKQKRRTPICYSSPTRPPGRSHLRKTHSAPPPRDHGHPPTTSRGSTSGRRGTAVLACPAVYSESMSVPPLAAAVCVWGFQERYDSRHWYVTGLRARPRTAPVRSSKNANILTHPSAFPSCWSMLPPLSSGPAATRGPSSHADDM